MFEKYDPRKGKQFRLLKETGTLLASARDFPLLSDEMSVKAYHYMIKARQADEWALSLQRQGRMPTYPPIIGQEANTIGAMLALRDDDWLVQAFREMGAMLVRGIPLRQIYLYYYGNEEGSRFEIEKYHTLPVSIPIASQLPHAVGLSRAEQYRGSDRISIVFLGDGGTSQGDFHEGLNFAGVWKAPVIIYIQNNQWAISVPRKKQTASPTLAEKAFAYGFEGVQIDGNDIFAVYAATALAAEKARSGGGPTLIEGYTYRMGPHTTSDDPNKYRSEEEVKPWKKKDPILRLEKYLLSKDLISGDEIEKAKKEARAWAMKEFEAVEKFPRPALEETFRFTFKEMPEILHEQMDPRPAFEKGGAL